MPNHTTSHSKALADAHRARRAAIMAARKRNAAAGIVGTVPTRGVTA